MIQIHIPSTQTIVDRFDSNKSYVAYDIWVNGAYHGSVRYSHLCTLHEKLIENFGFRLTGPDFPPKKIWRTLDVKAINERRENLARYFQGLLQINDISKHFILERAFLEFQVSSFNPTMQATNVEIYLPDGHPVNVDVYADDSTNVVMTKFCKMTQMNERSSEYFGLFLAKERENKPKHLNSNVLFDYLCVRWLKNFESPYISKELINKDINDDKKKCKIVIRRISWDPHIEEPLLDDPGSLKLLYLQAMNDIQHNYIEMTTDIKNELINLSKLNDYKNFMKTCHKLSGYGYEILESVVSDYPIENTKCCFKIGRRMIVLQYIYEGKLTQALLKCTRIKTWKISHINNINNPKMIFQLEYVLGTGVDLMTFETNQAILISLFLQSIADEILKDCRSESPTYKFDDNIQTKIITKMKSTIENSFVNVTKDNYSVKSDNSSSSKSTINSNNNNNVNPLLKIISYQMPFDNESFDFITDNDL